jgi:hypothetical protein
MEAMKIMEFPIGKTSMFSMVKRDDHERCFKMLK